MTYTMTIEWPWAGTSKTVTGLASESVEPLREIMEETNARVTVVADITCCVCPAPATLQTPEGMPYCSEACYTGR